MNVFRKVVPLAVITAILLSLAYRADANAPGPKVSEAKNKHNLSASNNDASIKYRAIDDPANPRSKEICVFCHTPHGANVEGQAPLWNRKFSTEIFQRYSSGTLQIRNITEAAYGEPNGSSKLCLSCHDGVSNLGDGFNGTKIAMIGGDVPGVIDSSGVGNFASFKPSTNKMKTGHHPVSFVYNQSVLDLIKAADPAEKSQYKLSDLPLYVKLDKKSRMQCTTCHDPHQNQSNDAECYGGTGNCASPDTRKITPFWVYGVSGTATAGADQEAVCISCHPMDAGVGFTQQPWTPN